VSKFSQATTLVDAERTEVSGITEDQLVQGAEQLATVRSASRLNRRKLITNLSVAAGAASMLGVAGCSNAGPAAVQAPTTGPSVLDILNFALNLEYFEASFYSYIVTGSGLSAADMGAGAGTATGGAKVTFTNSYVQNIAMNLMTEEVQHVELLRATIQGAFGVTPVSMPNLNLAALGAPTSDATFVALARTIEGVGVSAYAGGAQYLTTSLPALNYAAQILDVEAQHAGALRLATIRLGTTSPAADSLDMPPTMAQIFGTSNSTGLYPVRTISQVLGIVYGVYATTPYATAPAAGITSGGFFPNGFNGSIFST
jgi:hypothetical protein